MTMEIVQAKVLYPEKIIKNNLKEGQQRWPTCEDNIQTRDNRINPFPFGMIQTPFQITSNCPIKFHNNKVENPAQFLDELFRFKRGYEISENNLLENIDAVLVDEALEWCRTIRNNWRSLQDFKSDFIRTFLDEKLSEDIARKIKFFHQKVGEEIKTYLIRIRKLFAKLYQNYGQLYFF